MKLFIIYLLILKLCVRPSEALHQFVIKDIETSYDCRKLAPTGRTCGKCIGQHASCAWCEDLFFGANDTNKFQCDTQENLENNGCKTVAYPLSKAKDTSDSTLTDSQLYPRKVELKLRPDMPILERVRPYRRPTLMINPVYNKPPILEALTTVTQESDSVNFVRKPLFFTHNANQDESEKGERFTQHDLPTGSQMFTPTVLHPVSLPTTNIELPRPVYVALQEGKENSMWDHSLRFTQQDPPISSQMFTVLRPVPLPTINIEPPPVYVAQQEDKENPMWDLGLNQEEFEELKMLVKDAAPSMGYDAQLLGF